MPSKGSNMMLGAKELIAAAGSNGSAESCDSQVSNFGWLDNLKLRKYYPRGSVLFVEGQRPRGLFLLCQGKAKISISSAGGKTLILRIAQSGDLIGLNSVLTGRPYDATVFALEDCQIDFVSRANFIRLLGNSKAACVNLSQNLARQLTEIIESVSSLLLSQSAAEKLAKLLLRWCDEIGESRPQGIRLNHGLTQEEIAQMICASRETVTRLFAELKRRRIITFADNSILVRDAKALEMYMCGNTPTTFSPLV